MGIYERSDLQMVFLPPGMFGGYQGDPNLAH